MGKGSVCGIVRVAVLCFPFREEELELNIYVGNLSYDAAEDDVRNAFAAFGQISSVAVIKDRMTGRSKGFGFVEMPDSAQAQAAIAGLNGKDLKGRAMNINEARPRESGGGGMGGGGGGRGGGMGGGPRRY